MKTKLTKDEVTLLAPYEAYFKTAVNSSWCRYPGAVALQVMHDTLGMVGKVNTTCQACVFRLVKTTGEVYFASKEELGKVEVSQTSAKPRRKTSVKTTK